MYNNTTQSPFIVGSVVKDPSKFWGRKQEIYDILSRVQKMESTSIVGARRIGKSSLAYYIYAVGNNYLEETYEFVWLDGQSNYASSIDHFFKAITKHSSLAYTSGCDIVECLINFEDATKSINKKLIIIVNEFEILTDERHSNEFGIEFYNTLRFLAENGYLALVTTSYRSLRELCQHILGVSSPFYNIFQEMVLEPFSIEEADHFLESSHNGTLLTPSEIEFIKDKVELYQHPLILQIACDTIFSYRQNYPSDSETLQLIKKRANHFLSHTKVQEERRLTQKNDTKNDNPKISKPLDLLFSILIPVLGIGLLMLEYGLLIRTMTNFQAVLLALFTALLGFAVLIFAGRSIDIIGETTFYKLFLQLVKQIPLLSNIADQIIQAAIKLKGK